MSDLLIKNALLRGKKKNDILIQKGMIVDVQQKIDNIDIPIIDADNHFVCPPFVDSHFLIITNYKYT